MSLLFISCNFGTIEYVSYDEFQGANYWIIKQGPEDSEEDLLEEVERSISPLKTTYVFLFTKDQDTSHLEKIFYSLEDYQKTLLNGELPKYGFLKMPNSDLQDDALYYFKLALNN